jgi:hypothetical protein
MSELVGYDTKVQTDQRIFKQTFVHLKVTDVINSLFGREMLGMYIERMTLTPRFRNNLHKTISDAMTERGY